MIIIQQVITENKLEAFKFIVLTESDGVKLSLHEYTVTSQVKGNNHTDRWCRIGGEGISLKRESIIIPDTVINAAITKIISSVRVH